MIRKKYHILGLILGLIFIVACSSNDMPEGNLDSDMEKVKNISYDQLVEVLSKDIDDFIGQRDYYSLSNLKFVEDKLAIDDQDQVKKFNNITMKLTIEVDEKKSPMDITKDMSNLEKDKAIGDFLDESNRDLLLYLSDNHPLEYSKIGFTETTYEDKDKLWNSQFTMGHLRDSETMLALAHGNPEELLILDKTFKELKNYKEYEMKRFGIEDNTFLIEFIFHGSSDQLEEKSDGLASNLESLVLNDPDFLDYLKEEKAESMEVIFKRGEDDTIPLVYTSSFIE